MHTYVYVSVEVRGQLSGDSFLLPLCGLQRFYSSGQVCAAGMVPG